MTVRPLTEEEARTITDLAIWATRRMGWRGIFISCLRLPHVPGGASEAVENVVLITSLN